MRLIRQLRNLFRRESATREIEEELRSHLEEAIEQGREPREARRAFGSRLRLAEESRGWRLAPWLDSLAADVQFGWRQLVKNRTVTLAAVASLGLAIGSCTAAFRLIDALLLRPLPVDAPERLRVLSTHNSSSHPHYLALRDAVGDRAAVLAISFAERHDITFAGDDEMEKASHQAVSGNALPTLGVRPVLGRLLTPADDVAPGAHPYAVLSYDYWNRRFGRDPKVIGKTFRFRNDRVEIVGVLEPGFTGTATGSPADFFLPLSLNREAWGNPGYHWFRTWLKLPPGANEEPIRQILQAANSNYQRERVKQWPSHISNEVREKQINQPVQLQTAAAGDGRMQSAYRLPLFALAGVVTLVLLIACVNVANLLTAQAASRAREMAPRVSIGAGRHRLLQMMLVQSGLLTLGAMLLGGVFSWWSAPFVISLISTREDPVRLAMHFDWRLLLFLTVLAALVTVIFGLLPAVRASAVEPAAALKGGADPHYRGRLMNALIAAQVAFCFLVHFGAGLFGSTLQRVLTEPVGFEQDRLMTVELAVEEKRPREEYLQIANHVAQLPGVESAALTSWPLLRGGAWMEEVQVDGQWSKDGVFMLGIGPGWFETMRIPVRAGRDFRRGDDPTKVAVVTEAFAREFFGGENPIGRSFNRSTHTSERYTLTIIGLVPDVRYRDVREKLRAVAFLPYDSDMRMASVLVKLAPDAKQGEVAARIRSDVPRVRPGFRASTIGMQAELMDRQVIRERLLAVFSIFFAGVALLLSGVGLYGVLNYSVMQRRREIGIRMALGAKPVDVVRSVTVQTFAMLVLGSSVGLAAGIASERYLESLLFGVRATDLSIIAIPIFSLLTAGVLSALAPAIQAVRVDPAQTLRAE
jgi:putative ABC transport system permease protein